MRLMDGVGDAVASPPSSKERFRNPGQTGNSISRYLGSGQ